jgi:hypothetical protein
MLLNEVQKQRQLIEAQQEEIHHLNATLQSQQTTQKAEMVSLREEIKALRDLMQKSGVSSFAQLAGNNR